VEFWVHDYADVWFRDYGPIFMVDTARRALAMTHWVFNAWGGKYETLMKDTRIPEVINEKLLLPRFAPGIVLEGGSIDVDGIGTLLTTEQCLLNSNRNPSLTRSEIESCLMNNLGVKKVLWLREGISGDDTDGHVDDIARFVGQAKVLCALEEDPTDENHEPLSENFELLSRSTDCNGTPLQVIPLPMPGFVGDSEGRLPASYANFYIGNSVVLAPVFNHPNDSKALEIIQSAFPNRRVVGIDCRNLVHGLGTIHCISQQQPSVNETSS